MINYWIYWFIISFYFSLILFFVCVLFLGQPSSVQDFFLTLLKDSAQQDLGALLSFWGLNQGQTPSRLDSEVSAQGFLVIYSLSFPCFYFELTPGGAQVSLLAVLRAPLVVLGTKPVQALPGVLSLRFSVSFESSPGFPLLWVLFMSCVHFSMGLRFLLCREGWSLGVSKGDAPWALVLKSPVLSPLFISKVLLLDILTAGWFLYFGVCVREMFPFLKSQRDFPCLIFCICFLSFT